MVTRLDSNHILKILQLSDGFFPIGAFAFSEGLETATQRDEVVAANDVHDWLDHYVDFVFKDFEGPIVLQSMEAFPDDWKRLEYLNRELIALRPSSETRVSSQSLGLRLLKTCVALYPGLGLEDLLERVDFQECNHNIAVVHGAVFRAMGFNEREALLAFAYSRVSGTASAALRLASIGQQEMQIVLTQVLEGVPEVVDQILKNPFKRPESFSPLMDISQMEHRYLYSRLFRS